jgi:lysophospholipase L1-like esterase
VHWNHIRTVIVALAWIAAGAGAHAFLAPKPKLNAETYGRQRVEVISRHLSEMPAGYVFVAGDSHAELFGPDYIPCGGKTVNGGISGAAIDTYLDLLRPVSFPTKPAVVVLTLGTNDLLLKKEPGKAGNQESFAKAAKALIRRFQSVSPRVIVNAIPPVGTELRGHFDTDAIETYSRHLREICGALNCEFGDPFAALRSGEFGIATPGSMADTLHLGSYRQAYGGIGAQICDAPASVAQGG